MKKIIEIKEADPYANPVEGFYLHFSMMYYVSATGAVTIMNGFDERSLPDAPDEVKEESEKGDAVEQIIRILKIVSDDPGEVKDI